MQLDLDLEKLYRAEVIQELAQAILILEKSDRAWLDAHARVDHLVAALEITLIEQVVKVPNPSFQGRLLVCGCCHGHCCEEERCGLNHSPVCGSRSALTFTFVPSGFW